MLSGVTLDELRSELRAFVAERDWARFHSPENLAKSVSIEAAELLEEFQWGAPGDEKRQDVLDELADVFTYCLMLADVMGADPVEIVRDKLRRTREKYPVDRARGRSAKYDEL
ncbi:nucleotide pyrophosphohydrolase [Microbacterium indicum]|uniref:nucleotide pyrophosphohydrolase n=1 Tax=Microbacterium indicum TaxID=358100 RepID=UPI000409C27D|nr:nucleotide pyrophosphohydrolase [Microbacterium indicum]